MGINRIVLSSILTAGVIAAGLAQSVAVAADAQPVTGNVTVKLQYVHATLQNGSPDPAHDAACKTQLSSPTSKYVGMPVKTQYSINTQTLMMSASSSFPSPVSTQPLELTVPMHPLGIASNYSFGAFRPSELPTAYVLFSVSKQFTNPQSTFLILGPQGQTYNCVISSAKQPFKSAVSAKFGSDAQ